MESGFLDRLIASARRAGAGERQTDIAAFLGLHVQTVNQWFRRGYLPSRDMMAKIARAYGVSLEWLTEGYGEMVQPPAGELPPDAREVLRNYLTASPDTKKQIREIVRTLRKVSVAALASILPLVPQPAEACPQPAEACVLHNAYSVGVAPIHSTHWLRDLWDYAIAIIRRAKSISW